MLERGGRLYFCASNQKEVFRELRKNPFVELCASGENYSWLRLRGKARFSDDLEVKAMIQEVSPLVKSIYQTPDNPAFEAFYLEDAEATIADFSGNPPRSFVSESSPSVAAGAVSPGAPGAPTPSAAFPARPARAEREGGHLFLQVGAVALRAGGRAGA